MPAVPIERRRGADRRNRTVSAYLYGALNPRRVNGRRAEDRFYPIVDWHSPRVLALAFSILALCTIDAALTITLLERGAVEINPFMALFLPHALGWFVAVKLGLTAACLLILVACSPMRLIRAVPGEVLLYLILGCYVALIGHELGMLGRLT